MCGFFAVVRPPSSAPCPFAAGKALELLHHRGPDARGAVHIDLSWASVDLGMTRLKIVDQSDLEVPFDFREHLGVALAFNGEIYNWRDLARRLGEPEGGWRTKCDAEVVAAAWRKHGTGCLDLFNGMWGMVLVDTWAEEILVARDRAGEKPVYWASRRTACPEYGAGGAIYLTSEAKAFPFELRPRTSLDVATLEFDFREETPFEDVQALPPGSLFQWNHSPLLDDTFYSPGRWWELPYREPRVPREEPPEDVVVRDLTDLLVDAIQIRHVAEVPVAVQLSGGLDSSIVQAVVESERCYCVTFPGDGVDNLTAAILASQGTEVVPVTFSRDELVEVLPEVAYHLDTPATWTAVCQWFLNRKIAEDGNVIVLSGEGSDELFGGYARYRVLWWLEELRHDRGLAEYVPLIDRTVGSPEDVLGRMLDRGDSRWTASHARELVVEYGGGADLPMTSRMARTDFYTTMQVLLRMADRMAAAHSLENRSPFFDYRLMEYAARLHPAWKIDRWQSKAILRSVASELGVPYGICAEKQKKGLFVPASWGTGGAKWNRAWFAELMRSAWETRCCRSAICSGSI